MHGDARGGEPSGSSSVPAGGVDARFTLAAERTVLAWIRTALGFIAGGVAIVYVAPDLRESWLEAVLGAVMVLLGCAIAITGGLRWRRTTRVLRSGGEMPGPSSVLFVVAAIVVLSVMIVMAILIQQS